jgi:hypothetical protein
MRFSERKGLVPVRKVLQRDEMSSELRNTLWSGLLSYMSQKPMFLDDQYASIGEGARVRGFAQRLWIDHFKLPVDDVPYPVNSILDRLKKVLLGGKWYEVYDLLEAIVAIFDDQQLETLLNSYLERELAGYRLVDQKFLDITSEEEIEAVEQAIAEATMPGTAEHLRTALQLLSDRGNPDYRNSIKESISAVESAACVAAGKEKATLGDALKALESSGSLHRALKDGFSKLYGYTSDAQGIRHAMMEVPNLGPADAKFFLVACSAFINYLQSLAPVRTDTG